MENYHVVAALKAPTMTQKWWKDNNVWIKVRETWTDMKHIHETK